ncbi:MAG: hypothetical protein QXF24_06465 [Thermoproteota archaeon]
MGCLWYGITPRLRIAYAPNTVPAPTATPRPAPWPALIPTPAPTVAAPGAIAPSDITETTTIKTIAIAATYGA